MSIAALISISPAHAGILEESPVATAPLPVELPDEELPLEVVPVLLVELLEVVVEV